MTHVISFIVGAAVLVGPVYLLRELGIFVAKKELNTPDPDGAGIAFGAFMGVITIGMVGALLALACAAVYCLGAWVRGLT